MKNSALPVAWSSLRMLIALNWIYGAAILAILIGLVVATEWTLTALGVSPSGDAGYLLPGMQAIAVVGLISVPLNFTLLQRLLSMVKTVRAGDPFVASNAGHLNAIAWLLLAEQILGAVVALIGEAASTPAHRLNFDAGFSPSGWIAVVLVFLLARVFAVGTQMREDLDGTV